MCRRSSDSCRLYTTKRGFVLLLILLSQALFEADGAFFSFHRSDPFDPSLLISTLSMVRPGQSEEQAKAERVAEIRAKLEELKSSGKMKGGTAESMMSEAENFLNKESPLRKFEKSVRERKAKEEQLLQQREAEERIKEDLPSPDKSNDNTTV